MWVNREHWSALMISLFGSKKCLRLSRMDMKIWMQILHRCKEQRADMKKKKECKALFYIQHNANTNHFENISKITISKEACDILEKYNDGNEKVKLQSLGRKFKLMLLEGVQRLGDCFSNLLVVLNHMKACGENVFVQQLVEKVMRYMTFKFDFVVVSIQESKDVRAMKLKNFNHLS